MKKLKVWAINRGVDLIKFRTFLEVVVLSECHNALFVSSAKLQIVIGIFEVFILSHPLVTTKTTSQTNQQKNHQIRWSWKRIMYFHGIVCILIRIAAI